MTNNKCFIRVTGFYREDGAEIARRIKNLLGKHTNGDIEYSYAPNTVEVAMDETLSPEKAFTLHEKCESVIKADFKPGNRISVSLEVN